VIETETPEKLEFRTTKYQASVAESGFTFGSREFRIELGQPILRQGGVELELSKAKVSKPEFGVAQIDRGSVVEKYVFENRGA